MTSGERCTQRKFTGKYGSRNDARKPSSIFPVEVSIMQRLVRKLTLVWKDVDL